MANNRMWLVNHAIRARALLAKYDGSGWCWVVGDLELPEGGASEAWCLYYGDTLEMNDYTRLDQASKLSDESLRYDAGLLRAALHRVVVPVDTPRMWQPFAAPAWDWTDCKVG